MAVLVSEFGQPQPHAHATADRALADAQASVDAQSMRAKKVADYDRLAADLVAVQKQLVEAESEMDRILAQKAELQADVRKLTAQVAELHGQLDALTKPSAGGA